VSAHSPKPVYRPGEGPTGGGGGASGPTGTTGGPSTTGGGGAYVSGTDGTIGSGGGVSPEGAPEQCWLAKHDLAQLLFI